MRVALSVLAIAMVVGLATGTALVLRTSASLSPEASSPHVAPVAVAPSSVAAQGAGVVAAPPPVVVTPTASAMAEAPIARGVLVPDESELPSVPGAQEDDRRALRPRGAASDQSEASGDTVSTVASSPPSTSPPSTRPSSVRPGSSQPRGAGAADTGTLHVTVIPWGDVFVDGRAQGRSPVTVPLPPGTHRVRVESESGVVTRSVTISAGGRQELEVDLFDG